MKQSLLQITDIDCPNCHATQGEWCQRHGQVLGGVLLACALRSREVIRLNKIALATVICQWCNSTNTYRVGHSPLCVETQYECKDCHEHTWHDDKGEQQ